MAEESAAIEKDDDPSSYLTEGARRAIRSYMFKIVIPSAAVLSVASAAFGYVGFHRGQPLITALT